MFKKSKNKNVWVVRFDWSRHRLFRNAETKAAHYIQEFSRQMWKQLGMRVFVLSANVNSQDGTMSIAQ
jgi:hypothetical protein